jgi:amino acid transporter
MGVGLHQNPQAFAHANFPFVAATTAAAPFLQYLLYFAGFTSAIGVLFGSGHAGSRVLYNVARDGYAPASMARVHAKWQTPWAAILVPVVITMIAALVLGNFVGAHNAFDYTATFATDMFMVVLIVTNAATIPYFWRHQREQFSWFRHGLIPLLGIVAFGYPLYESVLPSQEAPYSWFGIAIIVGYVLSFLWGIVRRHEIANMGQRLAVD